MEPTLVAVEVAEHEFARFMESMDLDANTSRMDAEDLKEFEALKYKVVRSIMRGHLTVDDKGQPVFTPQLGETGPITFYEPTGATFVAADGKKKGHDFEKMLAIMGNMTRTNPGVFSKLVGRDFKVCQALVQLFLG